MTGPRMDLDAVVEWHRPTLAWETRGPLQGGETLDDEDARIVLRFTSRLRHWENPGAHATEATMEEA